MSILKHVLVAGMFGIALAGCKGIRHAEQNTSRSRPNVVTADIQEGIEQHIQEQTRRGGGVFLLPFGAEKLKLKLVRVHTEYLANLGPRRHFACVDLASADGDVYDVDFFLAGDPGAMRVTETTVHKINGQPLYVWEQKRNRTWIRVSVEKATPRLLGVIHEQDEFDFIYRAVLPKINSVARIWLPFPESDQFQRIKLKAIDVPGNFDILKETNYGNRVLFLELNPEDSGKIIELRFGVQRREKGVYPAPLPDPGKYLEAENLVPVNERFRQIAEDVIEGKAGDLVRARALYDHVSDRMRYMKYGSGWGKGDAVYACDARTGNCTDFHAYFIALSRSVGIPARFAIGAAIPSERNDGGIDGYHCWAEFYTDGRWWPVDISEGDKCSSLFTYYFGHHPANRIELSRGRDLVVEPGPVSGPINFLAYPILEIDGKLTNARKVEFSFKRHVSEK
jgi:transglutaminase-like putative cysteine protease